MVNDPPQLQSCMLVASVTVETNYCSKDILIIHYQTSGRHAKAQSTIVLNDEKKLLLTAVKNRLQCQKASKLEFININYKIKIT